MMCFVYFVCFVFVVLMAHYIPVSSQLKVLDKVIPLVLSYLLSLFSPSMKLSVRQHPTIKATAIHDDITLVGPPDDLLSACSTITNLALALGLQVQPSKCQLIYFHDNTTQAVYGSFSLILSTASYSP